MAAIGEVHLGSVLSIENHTLSDYEVAYGVGFAVDTFPALD